MNVPFVPLKDVVVTKTGSRNPSATPDIEFDYVDVASVDNAEKRITGARRMVGQDAPSRARKLIRTGDVLLATIRPNLNAVALVPPSLDGEVASTGFCVLRARDAVLPEYLFYFCRSSSFVGELCKLVAGAMYPAVTDSQVLDQRLPMRELGEQRRIVELLSRAEGIVRLRREAAAKAAELIPALFIHHFGDPATNPMGWPNKMIEDLCSVQTGATPRREVVEYYESGTVPWVKTGEVCNGVIATAEEFITERALSETNCKVFPVGTILLAMYGQGVTRGRAGMLNVPAATNQACAAILPSENVNRRFLFEFLRSQYERLRAMGRGGNQANLNLGMIKTFEVPLPPMAMQESFVADAQVIDGICSLQATALAKAQATFDALLAQAFAPA